jgi:phage-related protein
VYRIDTDAVVILDVFEKKSRKTPRHVIDVCRKRIAEYDAIGGGGGG